MCLLFTELYYNVRMLLDAVCFIQGILAVGYSPPFIYYVLLFILTLKIIFTCVKIVVHPRLMPHCGIIWVHITYILGVKIIVPQGY